MLQLSGSKWPLVVVHRRKGACPSEHHASRMFGYKLHSSKSLRGAAHAAACAVVVTV
jgi:hypothetical protein